MSKTTKTIAILGVIAGLGVAAMPLSSYAVEGTGIPRKGSNNVDLSVEILDKLTIDTTTTTTNGVALTESDATATSATKVVSNNVTGYSLSIKGNTSTAEVNGVTPLATDLVSPAGDILSAVNHDFANPGAFDNTKSEWGYRVMTTATNLETANGTALGKYVNEGAFKADTYAGVTTGDAVIVNTTKQTTGEGETTTTGYGFGVKADGSTPAGVYKGQITLTATNHAKAGDINS